MTLYRKCTRALIFETPWKADYCGARAFGFQALHLDRSDNARVTVYQDW